MMPSEDHRKRPQILLAAVILLIAWGTYATGAYQDRIGSNERRDEARYGALIGRYAAFDWAEESALADAYWRRYPAVAADPRYGPGGPFGLLGARMHYGAIGWDAGYEWGTD